MRTSTCFVVLTVFLMLLAVGVHAANTVAGIVQDCQGNPVPGVAVVLTTSGSSSCPSFPSSDYICAMSDASGNYSLNFGPPLSDVYVCVYAVPYIPSTFYYCTTCAMGKCCGGQKPNQATCGSPFLVAASTDGRYYPKNLPMSYSSACDTEDGSINTLTSTECTTSAIHLFWYAPSDSGCRALGYDVRYSTSPIDASNWSSATQVSGEPTPGDVGGTEAMWVSVPSSCTWYYFAIQAQLRNSRTSPLSNVHGARTKCPPSNICQISE